MKNRFYSVVIILLASTFISLSGCGGGSGGKKADPTDPIVGTWQFTKNTLPSGEVTTAAQTGTDMGFTFNDDGSYTFHNIDATENLQDAGNFSLDESAKKLTLNSSSGETFFLENFIFLDDNTFTSEGDPGIKDTLTWERVVS